MLPASSSLGPAPCRSAFMALLQFCVGPRLLLLLWREGCILGTLPWQWTLCALWPGCWLLPCLLSLRR